jgi:hypothetical protein
MRLCGNCILFIPCIVDNQLTTLNPTKCTILFPDSLYYNITLNTPTSFDPIYDHHQGITLSNTFLKCPAKFVLHDLISTILLVSYKLWSRLSVRRVFLVLLSTSSPLGPNIFPTLCSRTPYICVLRQSERINFTISHQYKTWTKIIGYW